MPLSAAMALWLSVELAGAPPSPPLAEGIPPRAEGSVGQRLVDDYRRKSGLEFARCDDAACLESALGACRPSHLARALVTVEGAPVFRDYFVVPLAEGCRVVEIGDASEDYWSGCKVTRRTCPTLAAATGADSSAPGCSAPEVLRQRKPCALSRDRLIQDLEGAAGRAEGGKEAEGAWTLREAAFKSIALSAVSGPSEGPAVLLSARSGAQARVRIGDFVGRERYRFQRAERIVGGLCCIFESSARAQERLCHRGAMGDFPVPQREPAQPPRP